jgi:hypothetical protein
MDEVEYIYVTEGITVVFPYRHRISFILITGKIAEHFREPWRAGPRQHAFRHFSAIPHSSSLHPGILPLLSFDNLDDSISALLYRFPKLDNL